jgi:hypothetical protein
MCPGPSHSSHFLAPDRNCNTHRFLIRLMQNLAFNIKIHGAAKYCREDHHLLCKTKENICLAILQFTICSKQNLPNAPNALHLKTTFRNQIMLHVLLAHASYRRVDRALFLTSFSAGECNKMCVFMTFGLYSAYPLLQS